MKTPLKLQNSFKFLKEGSYSEFNFIYKATCRYVYCLASYMNDDDKTVIAVFNDTYTALAKDMTEKTGLYFCEEDGFLEMLGRTVADNSLKYADKAEMKSRNRLKNMLYSMKKKKRICAVLYFCNGSTFEEIAGCISRSSVEVNMLVDELKVQIGGTNGNDAEKEMLEQLFRDIQYTRIPSYLTSEVAGVTEEIIKKSSKTVKTEKCKKNPALQYAAVAAAVAIVFLLSFGGGYITWMLF